MSRSTNDKIGYKFLRKLGPGDPPDDYIGKSGPKDSSVTPLYWKLNNWITEPNSQFGPKYPKLCRLGSIHYCRTLDRLFRSRFLFDYGEPLDDLILTKIEATGPQTHDDGFKSATYRLRIVEVIPVPLEDQLNGPGSFFRTLSDARYNRNAPISAQEQTRIWNAFWLEHNRPDLVSIVV